MLHCSYAASAEQNVHVHLHLLHNAIFNVRTTNQVLHGQRKGILQIDVGKMLIRMKKMTSH